MQHIFPLPGVIIFSVLCYTFYKDTCTFVYNMNEIYYVYIRVIKTI